VVQQEEKNEKSITQSTEGKQEMLDRTLKPEQIEELETQGKLIPEEVKVTLEEAKAIAKEAYIYGFPRVMNCKTVYDYVIDVNSPDYKGPFNQRSCEARLFTPDDKTVVTPNSDTPYCMFWMNLRAEPQVISDLIDTC